MASPCRVRSLSRRTICSSSRSITLRCSGMFTTQAECRIQREESNQFHTNPGLFALWHRDKHRAGLKVQEPSVIGDWRRRLKRLLCPALAGAVLTGATATIAGPVAVADSCRGTSLPGLAAGLKSNNRRRKPSRSAIPRTPVRPLSTAIAGIVPCSIAR
jgi:hypothetical protein